MTFSSPGNVTSSIGMFEWVNSVTSNWFFPGALLSVFIIAIINLLGNPANSTSKSFATASFITMILAVFARTIDLVSTSFMSIFIIFTAAGALWMHFENAS